MKYLYILITILLLLPFRESNGNEGDVSSDNIETVDEFGLSEKLFDSTKDSNDNGIFSAKESVDEYGLTPLTETKSVSELIDVDDADHSVPEITSNKSNNNPESDLTIDKTRDENFETKQTSSNQITDSPKSLTTLEVLVNKCVDLTATLENELASLKETIIFIKTTENEVLTIANRLEGLEQKYKDKFRTVDIVAHNATKKNDEIDVIKETVDSLKIKENDISKIKERVYTLEEQYGDNAEAIKIIKNETIDLESIRESVASFNIRRRDIARLTHRIDSMEEKHETSSETIETLKEAAAELRKGLEDQEIANLILKKDFIKNQTPINDRDKSIEEKLNVVSEIVVKHDKQLTSVIDNIKKLDLSIEANVIGRYSGMVEDKATTDSNNIMDIDWDENNVDNIKNDKEDDVFDVLKKQGYFEIGKGFYANEINFMPFGSSVELSGVILNTSGNDYNVANFKILLYNDDRELLREREFSITGIISGSDALPFYEIISGVDIEKISYYLFIFAKSEIHEELIKVQLGGAFEKRALINDETAEPKEKKNELITDEYEKIGGSFYVTNLAITISDYYCLVTGSIRNFSDEYYDTASFVIKLFNKDGAIIKEQDLYISINENSTIDLNETITGIEGEDIDSYKVMFKDEPKGEE